MTKPSKSFKNIKWLRHFVFWYKSALVGDALFFKIMSNLYICYVSVVGCIRTNQNPRSE